MRVEYVSVSVCVCELKWEDSNKMSMIHYRNVLVVDDNSDSFWACIIMQRERERECV